MNAGATVATEALLARQPIYEANGRTFAYELLYRSSSINEARFQDASAATAQVINHSFTEFGLDRIVGRAPAFINIPREFIMNGLCMSLPPERVVLEILEDTVVDAALLNAVKDLSRHGYKLALDDYIFQEHFDVLLPLCNYIKVDIRGMERNEIAGRMPALRGVAKLLAEKVETIEEFDFCRSLGFDYFQGFFFARPHILSQKKAPMNRVAIFRLVAKLHAANVSTHDVENIISEDLSLSYKVLRFVNSAFVGLQKQIESIGHAVRLVGLERIRLLASLIMMSSVEQKPLELMKMSLIRAKMCESLSMYRNFKNKELFFTVGLFSTLDAFLDCSMPEALQLLPLSDEVCEAILNWKGMAGRILESVVLYEECRWDEFGRPAPDLIVLRDAYLGSIEWTEQLLTELQ